MVSFVAGFLLPFQSVRLLFSSGVRLYVILPLLLNIGLFVTLAWFAGLYFDVFMDTYLPQNIWFDFIRPVLWILFSLAYAFLFFYGFTIVANILAAPFNAILSERIEQHLTGEKADHLEKRGFLSILQTTLLSELNKLVYFASRIVPLGILFFIALFIPGLNLLVSILWILFGFWFLALEYADYPMGNWEIKPATQRRMLARSRFKSLGFGLGITAMLLIPLVGLIAMPSAVAGATRYWVDDLKNSKIA